MSAVQINLPRLAYTLPFATLNAHEIAEECLTQQAHLTQYTLPFATLNTREITEECFNRQQMERFFVSLVLSSELPILKVILI